MLELADLAHTHAQRGNLRKDKSERGSERSKTNRIRRMKESEKLN